MEEYWDQIGIDGIKDWVWPDGKMDLLTKQLTIKKSWLRDILINLRLPSQVSLLLAQLIFRCSLPLKKNVWQDWPEIIIIIIYLMFYIFYTWSNYLRSVWSHPQRFGTLSVHFLCTFMSHAEKKFMNILSMFIWESKHQDIPFFCYNIALIKNEKHQLRYFWSKGKRSLLAGSVC